MIISLLTVPYHQGLIVSNDQHFNEAKKIDFPKITILNLEEFTAKFKKE